MTEADRRFQRQSERENARRVAEAPLLAYAGLVPLTTAEERRQRKAAIHLRAVTDQFWREVRNAQAHAQAQAIRAEVAGSVADLAPLDAAVWRIFGTCEGAYHVHFWAQVRDRVHAGLPPLEAVQTWTEAERAASQERVTRLKRVMEQVRAAHPDVLARARLGERKAWRELEALDEAALRCGPGMVTT